jgi:hypothetical protein
MTNDEQAPEFDPSASVWRRRWMEFNPFVQMGSQLQFDTIGPLVKQFAGLQSQLQFDTIGSLVKQFANPAWHETICSAIQRLADAEAEDGQESAEVSRQALSSNGLSSMWSRPTYGCVSFSGSTRYVWRTGDSTSFFRPLGWILSQLQPVQPGYA